VKRILSTRNPGDVVLLENLRFHKEEESNDERFARELKMNFDVYVSDAFGALHRKHASTYALPKLFGDKAAGLLVEKELRALTPLLEGAQKPFAVILGGVKISDKMKVIENLFRKVDRIFLGGAMVFTFLKSQGHRTGNSLVEDDSLPIATR